MRQFAPNYYRSFHCLADACPDSCCKEWDVEVDAASAAYYRSLPGDLGDLLRSVLQETPDGIVMRQADRRCPMWRKDGLCRIHAELGAEALCEVCRDFPRISHDYGDFVELGLELSCPEAARLILTAPPEEMSCRVVPGGSAPEYDREGLAILQESRSVLLAFLQNRRYPLPQRLAAILLYSGRVEEALYSGSLPGFRPEALLESGKGMAKTPDISCFLDFYKQLEILTPQWQHRLAHPALGEWQEAIAALARYGIQRYWLQAISDGEVWSRAKFIVSGCLLVNILGGDPIPTAQLYSKEIENDPENVAAILAGAYSAPALTDAHLLGLLFGAPKTNSYAF